MAPKADRPAVPTRPLSRVQQAVGRSVSESHATIPAAYTAMKMDVACSLEEAAALSKEVKRPVGLTEIFVRAVAGLHDRFPLVFAALDGSLPRWTVAPVAITIDSATSQPL